MRRKRPQFRTGLTFALSLFFAASCTPAPGDTPDAGPAEPPIDPGLLDPVLPFELAGRLSYNSPYSEQSLEGGPLVPMTEWHNLMLPDPSAYEETGLLAVASIPGWVVVAYPSAAHDGLAVAWGGLDHPWQTAELFKELRRPFIGAVDAVMNHARDGVLFAVRERFFPGRIWVLEWKPGTGVVTKQEVLRPAENRSYWWNDRCPDLRLGVSKRGDVDVLYMQDGDKLMRSRRPAGTVEWEYDLVRERPFTRSDVGCVNRIAYDSSDRAQVLTMVREWPEYERDPDFPDIDEPPAWNGFDDPPVRGAFGGSAATTISHAWVGLMQDGVGRWREDLDDYEPYAGVWHPNYWQLGGADLEEHPDGWVLSGVGVRRDVMPQVWFEQKDFAFDVSLPRVKTDLGRLLQPDEFDDTVDQAFQEFERWANVDRVNIGVCGDVTVFGRTNQLWPGPEEPYYFGWANDCLHAEEAPVRLTRDFLRSDRFRGMVHAHGRRAFDVAVCVHDATKHPVLCAGGFQEAYFGRFPPRVLAGAPPFLVSTSIADGAVDVPADTKTLEFVLSRPIAANESVEGQVVRVTDAERERVLLSAAGVDQTGKSTVSLPLPALLPGASYRVALRVSRDATPWSYLRDPAPVVTFRVAGLNRRPDLRDVAGVSNCGAIDGVREGGACVVGQRAPYAQGAEFMLPLDYDLEASGGRLPKLYDFEGAPVGGVTYEPRWGELAQRYMLWLKWRTALRPDSDYELRIDAEARNSFGASWHAEDRVWRFRTAAE